MFHARIFPHRNSADGNIHERSEKSWIEFLFSLPFPSHTTFSMRHCSRLAYAIADQDMYWEYSKRKFIGKIWKTSYHFHIWMIDKSDEVSISRTVHVQDGEFFALLYDMSNEERELWCGKMYFAFGWSELAARYRTNVWPFELIVVYFPTSKKNSKRTCFLLDLLLAEFVYLILQGITRYQESLWFRLSDILKASNKRLLIQLCLITLDSVWQWQVLLSQFSRTTYSEIHSRIAYEKKLWSSTERERRPTTHNIRPQLSR